MSFNFGHAQNVTNPGQFYFLMFNFVSRGEFKMLNFQVACATLN